MNSSRKAELIKIEKHKHENADLLSVIPVFGYTYVGNTEQWNNVEYGFWFAPDTLVDTDLPEFSFVIKDAKYDKDSNPVGSFARIKAKKIRGVSSYGVMIPATPELINIYNEKGGEAVFEYLNCSHYDVSVMQANAQKGGFATGGEVASPPQLQAPCYDLDSFQRFAKNVFVEGESVIASEKAHGCNSRFVYSSKDNKFHCGSKTEWKKEYPEIKAPKKEDVLAKLISRGMTEEEAESKSKEILDGIQKKIDAPKPKNLWWKSLDSTDGLKEWLVNHPDTVIYAETIGQVQKGYSYGIPNGEVRAKVFDIYKDGKYIDAKEARELYPELPWLPIVYEGPFDFNKLVELAEGKSLLCPKQAHREGIVVSPIKERYDHMVGRVKLKIVSIAYLEK